MGSGMMLGTRISRTRLSSVSKLPAEHHRMQLPVTTSHNHQHKAVAAPALPNAAVSKVAVLPNADVKIRNLSTLHVGKVSIKKIVKSGLLMYQLSNF